MRYYQTFSSPSGYGWAGTSPASLSTKLNKAALKIGKMYKAGKFQAIAFSGSSGAALAFCVAAKHKIPLIYIRKKNEECHGSPIEFNGSTVEVRQYLIVDDFISSGSTMNYIIDKIRNYTKGHKAYPAKPMGIFCYDGHGTENFKAKAYKTLIPVYTN